MLPTIRGDAEECYAITEEGAGSDADAIEATARRDGDGYLLNGEKWHVTSYNTASFAFFQAKLAGGAHDGEHAMFLVELPSFGVSVVRTPAYSHTISHHHPIVAFRDVRVPAAHLVGAEGDGMSFGVRAVPLRAAHGGSALCRRGGAAGHGDDRVRCRAAGAGAPDQRVRRRRGHARRQPDRAVRGQVADVRDGPGRHRTPAWLRQGAARAVLDGQAVRVRDGLRVADRAVQVFGGGRGYMRENVAERELRVERIWERTSEVQRAIIADQMAKRGVRAA